MVDKKQKWKLGGAKKKQNKTPKQLNGNNTCTYLVLFLLCVNLVAHAFCFAGASQMPMVRDILLPRIKMQQWIVTAMENIWRLLLTIIIMVNERQHDVS